LGAQAPRATTLAQNTVNPGPNSADIDVKDFRMAALEDKVGAMPEGSERDYFAGVLAGRSGQVDESIRLLNRALPSLRESQPKRAAIALETLADNYNRAFRYREAALAYDDLTERFAGQADHDSRDDAALAHLVAGVPEQTITWQGPVRLQTTPNPIGSRDAELMVNGVQGPWLLDTGANQSVVSRSFARRLGVAALPGLARTASGLTGIENALQAAVLPIMQIGGATLRNVVVIILDDTSLKIGSGRKAYQIDAILGYPVFQALGAITFSHDGEFRAGDAAERGVTGARMYMRGLAPVIECEVEGHRLPFTFDTGASGTNLSVRYYEQFRGEAKSWTRRTVQTAGAGGSVKREAYRQRRVILNVGDTIVMLKDVAIFPFKMNAGIDELFGNLGQDVVADVESFTLNFTKMTFSLAAPISARGKK
jgi:predicted aspartyl protease